MLPVRQRRERLHRENIAASVIGQLPCFNSDERKGFLGSDAYLKQQITGVAAAGLSRQLRGQKAEQGQRDHALPAERPACPQGDVQHFWINQRARRRGPRCCPLEERSFLVRRRMMADAAAATTAINRNTPVMTRPPKTAPSSADSQAYPATHRNTNAIAAAAPATANQATKPAVSPVFAWIQRMMFCWRLLSIRNSGEAAGRGRPLSKPPPMLNRPRGRFRFRSSPPSPTDQQRPPPSPRRR